MYAKPAPTYMPTVLKKGSLGFLNHVKQLESYKRY